MSRLSHLALLLGLMAGMGGLSSAAPASAAPAIASPLAGAGPDLLQEVRWATRCRPVVVHRRDRYGRPVRVERERCRRVWVGPGRGPRGPY
ncbi:hypothetical protein ACFQX4_19815 [Roseomonas sp. GCM10028921]